MDTLRRIVSREMTKGCLPMAADTQCSPVCLQEISVVMVAAVRSKAAAVWGKLGATEWRDVRLGFIGVIGAARSTNQWLRYHACQGYKANPSSDSVWRSAANHGPCESVNPTG